MIDKILGAVLGFGAASVLSKSGKAKSSPKKRSTTSAKRKTSRSSAKKTMPQKPKSARFNYDRYISVRDIDSALLRNGKMIDWERILSGAYVSNTPIKNRLSSQFAKGGTLECATYIPINELASVTTKSGEVIQVKNLYSGVWYE